MIYYQPQVDAQLTTTEFCIKKEQDIPEEQMQSEKTPAAPYIYGIMNPAKHSFITDACLVTLVHRS